MALLTKDQIIGQRSKLKTRVLDVPEWGGEVLICELTGASRDRFEAESMQFAANGTARPNLLNIRAKLCALSIVDPTDFETIPTTIEHGTEIVHESVRYALKPGCVPRRMFSDAEIADLGQQSAAALNRVFDAAQKLSGITKADIDELATGLKNDQSASSGSN